MNDRAPLNIQLNARTDAEYLETVGCTGNGQPFDFTDWTGLELVVAASLSATAALFSGTVTASSGLLTLQVSEATIKSQLPQNSSANYRNVQYVVRGRPHGTYRVCLMWGTFRIDKGLAG